MERDGGSDCVHTADSCSLLVSHISTTLIRYWYADARFTYSAALVFYESTHN
jgi:hypothetical protein